MPHQLPLALQSLRLAVPAELATPAPLANPACSAILAIRSTASSLTCLRLALLVVRFAVPANQLRLAVLALRLRLPLPPLPLPRLAPRFRLATELK